MKLKKNNISSNHINNAADEDYITGGLNVPDSLGWAGANYGPPRTYGASLRYRF